MPLAKRKPRHEARQARTDVYRQHVFEAAEQVFAEHGFEAAKLQDISKRVGLSMGTIYSIFPSKGDMLRAILDERGQAILTLVRDITGRESAPRDALNALIEGYIDYFHAHPGFLRMHLRQGGSWVLSPAPSSDSRSQVWEEIHRLQAGIFRRGVKDGTFIDEDPDMLAKMFSAMDQVLLSEWAAQGMKAKPDELVRRLQGMVERAFCRRAARR